MCLSCRVRLLIVRSRQISPRLQYWPQQRLPSRLYLKPHVDWPRRLRFVKSFDDEWIPIPNLRQGTPDIFPYYSEHQHIRAAQNQDENDDGSPPLDRDSMNEPDAQNESSVRKAHDRRNEACKRHEADWEV